MYRAGTLAASLLLSIPLLTAPCLAGTITPAFSANYTDTSLGAIPGVPPIYGGVAFNPADPTTLYITSDDNASGVSAVYSVPVTRNAGGHINGFGTPSIYSTIPAGFATGLAFGPGNVLFYSVGQNMGEIKPGSTSPDKMITNPLNLTGINIGAIGFAPNSPGQMVILAYDGGAWYDATYSPDGTGTYNVTPAATGQFISGRPIGVVWLNNQPQFPGPSVLINYFGNRTITDNPLDATGHPVVSSFQNLDQYGSAVGLAKDPLTNDVLFVDYSNGSASPNVDVITGFVTPEPASLLLFGCALPLVISRRSR